MEEIETFITNFDFENSLQQNKFVHMVNSRANSKLEFIFLWMAQENQQLLSLRHYEEDYLQFIKECRGLCPPVVSDGEGREKTWWGKLDTHDDWLKERVINSNVTALEVRNQLNLNILNSFLCRTANELKAELKQRNEDCVIKEEFGFSGRGLHFNDYEKNSYPVIVEKSVQRVRDFGIRIGEDHHYIVQNLIDKKGTYKGSLVKDLFQEEELILEESKKIFEAYKDKFQITEIQIDSFQYLENGVLHYNPFCEVNHRRSMSGLSWGLHKDFGNEISVVLMVNRKKMKILNKFSQYDEKLGNISYNSQVKKGVIPLSPVDSCFALFYLTEVSERSLQHLIKDLWKKVTKEGERLPSEFVVYF